jgi:hypothetical protein
MANTVIQLKYSEVTSTPPSLNTSEPAYSNTSGKLFIGDSNGTPIAIGGEYYTNIIDSASSSATPSTLVLRDTNGSVTANQFIGDLAGSANSADQLTTARDIGLDGDATGNVSFDGSQNVTLTTTLSSTGVVAATYGGATQIPTFTVDAKGRLTAAANVAISTNLNIAADAGSNVVSLADDTLTFIGGDGVTTTLDPTNNVKIDVDNTVIRTIGDQTITGNTTLSGTLSVDSNKITNLAAPTTTTDAANKAYVDEVAQGLKVRQSAWVLTDVNVDSTYDPNGFETDWATLTANTNGAFPTTDGVDTAELNVVGARFLIAAQDNSAHNGLYVLVQPGNGSNPWVLRRCGSCRTNEQIPGSFVFIQRGTQYKTTGWVAVVSDPATFVVGVDSIGWTQFSGAGTFTAGAGLTLTGTEFSISNTSVTAGSYGASSNTISFTVNSSGQLTAVTENEISISADQIGSGTLPIARGGTNQTTFTTGSLVAFDGTSLTSFANSTYTLTGGLAAGNTVTSITVDDYGRLTAVTGAEINIDASQIGSGTIAVGRGGTGNTSLTQNGVLIGQGTDPLTTVFSSTEGHVLQINGSGVPVFDHLNGGSF